MDKYFITKRTYCNHNPDTFIWIPYDNGTMTYARAKGCGVCGLKGYVDTDVDFEEQTVKLLQKYFPNNYIIIK